MTEVFQMTEGRYNLNKLLKLLGVHAVVL